jgi:hypothetical protein
MAGEFLGDRKKALEESFFAKEHARLLERMKAEEKNKAARERLAEISGIDDEAVLAKLVELDIEIDTWAAISLVPLVEVAWADGKIDEKERQAVLSGAEANGIRSGTPSHELLESWLAHRPDARLLEVWGEYIVGLCAKLGDGEKAAVKEKVIGRARDVAKAAGGFLGLGAKISAEEEVMLSDLEKAFE